MKRRGFLKLLGYSSAGLSIPMNLQWFIDKVVSDDVPNNQLQEIFGNLLNKVTQEEMDYLNNLDNTYTIFRVGGGRVRVTNDLKNRLRRLGWPEDVDILKQSKNIFEVSLMEYRYNKELQMWSQPYFWNIVTCYRSAKPSVVKRRKANTDYTKFNKLGGYHCGYKHKKTGHISNLGKEWGRINAQTHVNKVIECSHCGESCNVGNIKRWHDGGKCIEKRNTELQILEKLNEGLSMSKVGKLFGMSPSNVCLISNKYK